MEDGNLNVARAVASLPATLALLDNNPNTDFTPGSLSVLLPVLDVILCHSGTLKCKSLLIFQYRYVTRCHSVSLGATQRILKWIALPMRGGYLWTDHRTIGQYL
jgi:hypothetical protein